MQLKQNIKLKSSYYYYSFITDWLSGRLVTIRSQTINCIWENALIERPDANVIDQHVTVLRISIPSWIRTTDFSPTRKASERLLQCSTAWALQHSLVAIIRTTIREVITASRYIQYKVEVQEKKRMQCGKRFVYMTMQQCYFVIPVSEGSASFFRFVVGRARAGRRNKSEGFQDLFCVGLVLIFVFISRLA